MADRIKLDDDLIAVDEMELGVDDDGMPKTVPGKRVAKAEAEVDEEAGDKKEAARLSAIQRERDELREERDRLAADAADKAARLASVARERDTLGSRLEKVTGQGVEAHRAAVRERYQRALAEQDHVKSGIGQAKSMLEQARADLRAAHAAGDADRITDLTDHLSAVRAHLNQLETNSPNVESYVNQYKHEYETTEHAIAEMARAPREEPKPEPEKKQSLDEWIAASPAVTHSWLRDNKTLLADPKGFQKVNLFAREYQIDHGDHAINTKAFTKALEAKFNPQEEEDEEPPMRQEEPEEDEVVAAPKPKKKVTAAAPVSRNAPFSSRNLNAKDGKLPPRLAATVKAAGMDATSYFRESVKLIKEGKLPANFLDDDYPHQY